MIDLTAIKNNLDAVAKVIDGDSMSTIFIEKFELVKILNALLLRILKGDFEYDSALILHKELYKADCDTLCNIYNAIFKSNTIFVFVENEGNYNNTRTFSVKVKVKSNITTASVIANLNKSFVLSQAIVTGNYLTNIPDSIHPDKYMNVKTNPVVEETSTEKFQSSSLSNDPVF